MIPIFILEMSFLKMIKIFFLTLIKGYQETTITPRDHYERESHHGSPAKYSSGKCF